MTQYTVVIIDYNKKLNVNNSAVIELESQPIVEKKCLHNINQIMVTPHLINSRGNSHRFPYKTITCPKQHILMQTACFFFRHKKCPDMQTCYLEVHPVLYQTQSGLGCSFKNTLFIKSFYYL